jgi:ligand-binding SRPBCC domain-containing protein
MHLGVIQHLTVRITKMDYPIYFQDSMVKGAFKSFTHDHYFENSGNGTLMRDEFRFTAPLGVLGRVAEALLLKKYMKNLLLQRNSVIKQLAETGKWRNVLTKEPIQV